MYTEWPTTMEQLGHDNTAVPPSGTESPTQGSEKVQLQVRLPTHYEGEIRYANHVVVSFNGSDFVLTLAQIALPLATNPEEFLALMGTEPITARILDEFAIPAERFADAIDRFAELVARMRSEGSLSGKGEQVQ